MGKTTVMGKSPTDSVMVRIPSSVSMYTQILSAPTLCTGQDSPTGRGGVPREEWGGTEHVVWWWPPGNRIREQDDNVRS